MKPKIIVLSSNTDSEFRFMSDGWFSAETRDDPANIKLMERARQIINGGESVQEVIGSLEKGGFEVVRVS